MLRARYAPICCHSERPPPSPSGRAAAAASACPHHSCGPCSPAAAAPSCPGPSHTRHGLSHVALNQPFFHCFRSHQVGVHGAGLTLGMLLPPCAAILEVRLRRLLIAARCAFHVAWVSGLAARRAMACFRKHRAGNAAIVAKSLQWEYHNFDVRYYIPVVGIALLCMQPRCAHVSVLQLRGLHYDRIRVPQARATATSVSCVKRHVHISRL
jgi:hypothetical protein